MVADLSSTVLRGLAFIAMLQAGGAVLFLALMDRQLADSRGAIVKLARVAVVAGAALLVAQYLMEPARMAGAISGAWDIGLHAFLLDTRTPLVVVIRLGALVLLWLALRHSVWLRALGLPAVLLIAASFAATGHTARSPSWWWLGPLLVLHLLIVQFWFGSLLPLLAVARNEAGATAARIVQRFSSLANWSVPLILIAGLAMAAGLLPDTAALAQPYGMGLILKVLAFAALMALAAANKWRLGPALERGGTAAARLGWSIGVEFMVIAAVLMGTAALTTFWSPGS